MLKKIVPMLLVFLLFGCLQSEADNAIDLVKNGHLDFDPGITIGDALDKNRLLADQKWSSFETERGKRIVEFESVVSGFSYDSLKKFLGKHSYSDEIDLIKKYDIKLLFELQFEVLNDGFEVSYVGYGFKGNQKFFSDFNDEEVKKFFNEGIPSGSYTLESIYNQKEVLYGFIMDAFRKPISECLRKKRLAEQNRKERIEIEEMFKAKAKKHEGLPVVGFEQMIDDLVSSEKKPQVGNWIYVGGILTRYGNMARIINSNVMRGNRYPDYLICDYPAPGGDENDSRFHLSIATPVMSSMEELLELFGGVQKYNVLRNGKLTSYTKNLYGHASIGNDYIILDDPSGVFNCYDYFYDNYDGSIGFQSVKHPGYTFEFDIDGIGPMNREIKKNLRSNY